MTTETGPEKARHIDDRITRIGFDDLVEAFGRPVGVTDLGSLRLWVAAESRTALWPVGRWADAWLGTDEAAAAIAAADALREDPPDVTGAHLGRSARYGHHYLGWLRPAVQAWELTGDEAYVHTFEKLFLKWAREKDGLVGEWPGLDLIWYSLGTWARAALLLPALDSLRRSPLSDECWGEIMAALIGGARWAYDEHDAFRHGNWQFVSASHLLHVGAVYPQLMEAAAWRERGRERLVEHLDQDIRADGGHHERSPGYHSMCLDAVQLALAVDELHLQTGLAEHPKVRAMHHWLLELTSNGGWAPHLQDSGIVWSGPALLRGGLLLDDPELVRAAERWLPEERVLRELAALPTRVAERRPTSWPKPHEPRSVLLPDSGYAVLRANDLRVVVNCGPYVEHELESHSHNAVLDFVVDHAGEPLLWEAGGPPDYDDPTYQTWYRAARGHNTVVVDGGDLCPDRDAVVETFRETAEVAVLTARHRGYGFTQQRTFVLVRTDPAYLVVRDTTEDDTDRTYELHLHSPKPWRGKGDEWESGVRAWLVGAADDPTALTNGVARIPDQDTGTAAYGPLHTLGWQRTRGDFTTVLAPNAEGWHVFGTDSALTVVHPAGEDLLTRTQLSRKDADGNVRWLVEVG